MARTSDQTGKKVGTIARLRTRAARVIRIVFTVMAVMLAVAALLVALRHNINATNPIVRFVTGFDDAVDGPFSRSNGIFAFAGKNAATKEALVNWGIAALVYLAIGRVLDRIVRP
ncbi:MAG: hypothetical protein ABI873_07615 [Marmoricola sp.]